MDRLLTTEQTADHFQVHPKTINAWVAKGILAATDIGGVRRFKASDIAATEQAGRKVVTAPEPEPKAPVQLLAAGGVCKPCRSTRTNQTRKERRLAIAGLEAASTSANSQRPANTVTC